MKITLKGTPLINFPEPPTTAQTPPELMQALRNIRGFMLSESDWTQVADSPLDAQVKEEWRLWRQEMRDVTNVITVETVGDYFEVSDPPSQGLPPQWSLWEWGNFSTIEQQIEWANEQNHNANTSDGIES